MHREVLLVDDQIRCQRHDLRANEYLIRKFIRERRYGKVRFFMNNLTRKDCEIVATNTIGGRTLLHHAVKSRSRRLVSFLVECGARVDEKLWLEANGSVLMPAVKMGDLSMIMTLDKLRADLKIKDRKDANAVVYALLKRHVTVAKYLRLRSVDINTAMSVHHCSKSFYYLKQALNLKFDINFLGTGKNTVFILAACWGRVDILKTLISLEVDINHRNSRGFDALGESLYHKKYHALQFFMSELYSVSDYIDTLEFNGASDMIFQNDFEFSFDCWVSALEMRKLFGLPRQKNSTYRDNIGEEYVTLDDLNRIANDSLKLVLQALLIFLRILSPSHTQVHHAMVTVATHDYLMDDYRATLKLLTQLFTMHDVKAEISQSAGYKALKGGTIVLDRTVDVDARGNAEDIYFMRFELFFSFITINVWSLLCSTSDTNLSYYNCYKKYLSIVLDLLSLMYCEGIIAEQEPLLTLLLGVLVKKQIPFYPISLLHVAVEKDYGLSIINLLIKSGAQADCKDIDGNTPIDFATAYPTNTKNKKKIINVLISAGANIKEIKYPRYRSHKIVNKRPMLKNTAKLIKLSLGQVSCSEAHNIALLCRAFEST